MRRYDAIVLGAGPSGLAAGVRLAQFDCDVLVLERHYVWGGLNSFYKKGGRLFDAGMHALTNWAPPGERGAPLTKLLRQLRLRHADLALGEQTFSEIAFPELRLRFSNDHEELRASVAATFPHAIDRFDSLVARVREQPLNLDEAHPPQSARAILMDALGDEALVDALMLPICYYGSPREDDCDWDLFAILFRSILLEGFARPDGGMRPFWKRLVERYKSLGGELRLRTGAQRLLVENGRVRGVVTDTGEELRADRVLSSIGWAETRALCSAGPDTGRRPWDQALDAGEPTRLSFVESISVLDRLPSELGLDTTITFFCNTERFSYRRPQSPVDLRSGVIATPNNYANETPLSEGFVRATVLANPDGWRGLEPTEYAAQKERLGEEIAASVCRVVPDFRDHVVYRDTFTPRTIEHFTGHFDGAIYGTTDKQRSGETGVEGLILIGTDQGLLGIVGAMLSGVMMANRHVLTHGLVGGRT